MMATHIFSRVTERNSRLIVTLFFVAFLCIGILLFRDYGISGDEIVNRNNGLLTYRYIFEGDPQLLTYRDRYYGTVFEVLLILLEKMIGPRDTRTIFFMRHLATFLLFYVGVIFFYLLCKRHFKSWKTGLLGSLFLILSPRIFAHAFYNSKDIAFLSLFIVSIYSLIRYLDKKTSYRAAVHALACALLIDTRITGILLPVFTVIFFFADLLIAGKSRRIKVAGSFFVYLLLLFPLTALFWPVLWRKPVYHFVTALRQMGRFPWNGTVLYLGNYVNAGKLPWHYIPVWLLITTPLFYSLCFFAGLSVSIISFLKYPLRFYSERRDELIFLFAFFVPLIAVIVLKSVLYDGWRHMFFIYPAFLIFSLRGLKSGFEFVKSKLRGLSFRGIRALLLSLTTVSLLSTAYFMVKCHPYQNIYFNMLTGGMQKSKYNFEMDYWGLSYRRALEYIAQKDKAENIKVYVSSLPGRIGAIPALILKTGDRRRFKFVDTPAEAKYFVGNYRWHREEYPYDEEIFSIKKGGAKIVVVYEL